MKLRNIFESDTKKKTSYVVEYRKSKGFSTNLEQEFDGLKSAEEFADSLVKENKGNPVFIKKVTIIKEF